MAGGRKWPKVSFQPDVPAQPDPLPRPCCSPLPLAILGRSESSWSSTGSIPARQHGVFGVGSLWPASGGCELGGWLKTSFCISAHEESKAVCCGHSRRGDTQQHVPAVCLAKRGVLQCSSARVCSIRVGQMKGASQHPYLRAATGCLRENTRDGGRTGQSFPSTLTFACRAGALGTRAPGGEQVRQEQGG